jgi:hypothetical protein
MKRKQSFGQICGITKFFPGCPQFGKDRPRFTKTERRNTQMSSGHTSFSVPVDSPRVGGWD